MKDTKAFLIVPEALMRIIFTAIGVFFFVGACNAVAEVITGNDGAGSSLTDLVNELSNINGADTIFLSLNEDSAIIGFSKDAVSFVCQNCFLGSVFTGPEFHYGSLTVSKPDNPECIDKSCVCLCTEGLDSSDFNEVELTCEQFRCQSLNRDIYSPIALGQKQGDSYWEHGFIFIRSDDIPDGLSIDRKKRSLGIESKKIRGTEYVAACPQLPCFTEQK